MLSFIANRQPKWTPLLDGLFDTNISEPFSNLSPSNVARKTAVLLSDEETGLE
jgi:hypothetical protein